MSVNAPLVNHPAEDNLPPGVVVSGAWKGEAGSNRIEPAPAGPRRDRRWNGTGPGPSQEQSRSSSPVPSISPSTRLFPADESFSSALGTDLDSSFDRSATAEWGPDESSGDGDTYIGDSGLDPSFDLSFEGSADESFLTAGGSLPSLSTLAAAAPAESPCTALLVTPTKTTAASRITDADSPPFSPLTSPVRAGVGPRGLLGSLADFADLGLHTLPPALMDASHVAKLSLSRNTITVLPDSFGDVLQDLEEFRCNLCKLRTLPDSIGCLVHLTTLALFGNEMEVIPASIGGLRSLRYLSLAQNRLQHLPETLGELTALRTLKLSNNCLETLPASLTALAELTRLELDGNHLTALPNDIGALALLCRLELRDNRLAALPLSISRLGGLVKLCCSNNRLTELPPSVAEMVRLEEVKLDSNRLQSIPAIPGLTALRIFDVGDNMLTEIPDCFDRCHGLVHFDASQNDLIDLPFSLSRLSALEHIGVKGNRRLRVPVEVENNGTDAIKLFLRYWEEMRRSKGSRRGTGGCAVM